MSHMYPEGSPVSHENQGKPDVIGCCEVCGEEITEGSSYVVVKRNRYVCSDFGCMKETIYQLEGGR